MYPFAKLFVIEIQSFNDTTFIPGTVSISQHLSPQLPSRNTLPPNPLSPACLYGSQIHFWCATWFISAIVLEVARLSNSKFFKFLNK